jgi:hypothetical protein
MGFGGSKICYFFGQGEDSGLAGDVQEAAVRLAAEPGRPLQTAEVYGTIEAVARQGFGD